MLPKPAFNVHELEKGKQGRSDTTENPLLSQTVVGMHTFLPDRALSVHDEMHVGLLANSGHALLWSMLI